MKSPEYRGRSLFNPVDRNAITCDNFYFVDDITTNFGLWNPPISWISVSLKGLIIADHLTSPVIVYSVSFADRCE